MLVGFLKTCLNKLKNTFVYREFINNVIVISIIVILFLLTINNLYFLPLFAFYVFYIYKENKLIILVSSIFIFVISVKLIVYKYSSFPQFDKIKVNDVIQYDTYQKIIYKRGYKKIIIYDFDNLDIIPNDVISVELEESNILGERIEGGFDYQKYLKNNHIYKVYNLKKVNEINRSKFGFFNLNMIKYKLNKYVNNNFSSNTRSFLKGLVLGNKNEFEDEFVESLKGNGTIHLFAISGLHIGIIIIIINKLLDFFKVKKKKLIISLSLFVYLFITSFSPSVIRAVLMYYLSVLNKKLKLGFSSSDIISLTLLILLVIDPLYMYNQGFILSFAVSYFIILFTKLISRQSEFRQSFLISLVSNLFVLPIVINMNNEINLLSPIINVVFIFLVSSIILPFSFLVMVLPFLKDIYESVVNMFTNVSIFFNNNISIKIIVPSFSKISIAIYYYLLISILYFYYNKNIRRNLIVIILIFLFGVSFIKPMFQEDETVFFDLDEGDATLIYEKSKECIALIDTGTGKNNEITNYLKRKGIRRLDYLILTHNHNDHNGEAKNILEEINVNKIVVSAYDNSEYSYYKNSVKVKSGDKLSCGSMSFNVLHPDRHYDDMNDNSIVIHTKIGKHYFLFLGDASSSVEEKFKNIKVDCIKISHHGSKTATSLSFIQSVNPKYAVIMSGRVKKFGFPNHETISKLNSCNVIIYRTDLDYSIIYKNGKFKKTKK